MNKGQLIDAVAVQLGDTKANAQRAVDVVIDCITNGVKVDGGVTISGFGTFTQKQRKARISSHPITRQPMEIKASKTVGFKPSQMLKQSL
jgi:DNA-binding protein HU-beta